jgi:hypothetical protein
MTEPPSGKLARYARRIAIALGVLIVGFAALFVSLGPAVEVPHRPTPGNIAAARDVWRQLKAAQGTTGQTSVQVDNEAILGIAALASDATGYARFEAGIARGELSGQASIALPAGLWINASVRAAGEHAGFPAYRLKIGRLLLPQVASRWAAELGRLVLRMKGAKVPPLDEMVRHVEIGPQQLVADLVLPLDSGVVNGIVSAGGRPLDQPLVSDIYCRIAAAQRRKPVSTLAELVRQTFASPHVDEGEDFSRAAFVALSFLVVGDRADALAPQAAALAKDCPRPRRGFVLQQREDLAMHWAFSAGLTAVLGEETAASLGEWKELHDSLANGTGFSFVDLAADRSGMQTALRVLDPGSAAEATLELGRATDEYLLPEALLERPEGLSDSSFMNRFGALDRERYKQAVASIDRTLAGQRSAGTGQD